jgi:rhodanese-related sulfurtransferase
MSQNKIEQLAPHRVRAELEKNEGVKLLDVRGPDEYRIASIEGALLVTENRVQEILDSWPKDTQMILHCHHGFRSQQACEFFQAQGFQNLANMTGGIDAWSQEVDPTIQRY